MSSRGSVGRLRGLTALGVVLVVTLAGCSHGSSSPNSSSPNSSSPNSSSSGSSSSGQDSTAPGPVSSAPTASTPKPSDTTRRPQSSAPPSPTRAAPAGFTPSATAFLDAAHGWVLGNANCATPPCTTLLATADGGRSWQRDGAPPAPLSTGAPQRTTVRSVRFADAQHGYLFGGALYETGDGGRSWTRGQLGPSRSLVVDVQIAAGQVYAAVACSSSRTNCPTDTVSVYRSPIGSSSWQLIGAPVATLDYAISLSLNGSAVWLRTGQTVYRLTSGRWVSTAAPCADPAFDLGTAQLAASGPQQLSVLCVAASLSAASAAQLRTSSDSGAHWSDAGPRFQLAGDADGLAADPAGVRLVARHGSADSGLLRSTGSGSLVAPRIVIGPTAGAPWADLDFVTATDAVAVLVGHNVYRSADSGATWSALNI